MIVTDSPISFPGLFGDWEFTAGEIALHVGRGVYWYGILIGLGVLAGLWLCSKLSGRFGLKEDHVLDLVLWGVPLGILGARTYYVIFYLDLYRDADGAFNWGRAIAIWDGGLAIYGAVIAVFIMVFVYAKCKKIPMGALTDMGVMGLLIGQAIGRWGNFMNREAFGAETTLPWRMRLLTTAGEYVEVHPTFLYECLWNLVGLALMVFIITKARRFDGENTWFYFLWYGVGRFWIEGLRTDSLYLFDWTLMGQPIRVSQALSAVMVVVSALMLVYQIGVRKPSPENLYVNRLAKAQAEAAEQDAVEADAGEETENVKEADTEAVPETGNAENETGGTEA